MGLIIESGYRIMCPVTEKAIHWDQAKQNNFEIGWALFRNSMNKHDDAGFLYIMIKWELIENSL